MHEFSDSAGVGPMTVLPVGHVDDVDPGQVGVRLSLHDVRASTDQSSSGLHRTETTVANRNGYLSRTMK